MTNKPFWKSLTFWGLVLSGAAGGAETSGVIPSGTVSKLVEFAGLILALVGRAKATQPLGVTQ